MNSENCRFFRRSPFVDLVVVVVVVVAFFLFWTRIRIYAGDSGHLWTAVRQIIHTCIHLYGKYMWFLLQKQKPWRMKREKKKQINFFAYQFSPAVCAIFPTAKSKHCVFFIHFATHAHKSLHSAHRYSNCRVMCTHKRYSLSHSKQFLTMCINTLHYFVAHFSVSSYARLFSLSHCILWAVFTKSEMVTFSYKLFFFFDFRNRNRCNKFMKWNTFLTTHTLAHSQLKPIDLLNCSNSEILFRVNFKTCHILIIELTYL